MAEKTRRCFYEVLGVERTANEAELKVAYRKLALKWHPDKNLDNPDATAIFQEIQSAYAVLSDAQERSWYDSHRDEILRGGDGQGGAEDPDAYVVNVWPFFSGSAYSGYGDGEGGFYQVYRELFEKIDLREQDESERQAAPGFGSSDAEWADVSAFYAHWSNFVSRLSFGWADEYREQDAPSRQIRRAMEKENKKARDAAKRKYQETIRALVEFMRKRDKRVIKHQVEAQRLEAERARQEAEAAKVRAEEYKKERAEWLKQQQQLWEEEEAKRTEEERAGGSVAFRLADEDDSDDDDEDDGGRRGGGKRGKKGRGKGGKGKGKGEAVIYECVICGNTFKSEKQKANHEKSRAHRKMVESLKEEFGDGMLDDLHPGDDEEEGEGGAKEGGDGEGNGHAPGAVAEATAAATEGAAAQEEEEEEEEGKSAADSKQEAEGQSVQEQEEEDDDDDDSEEDLARMNRFAQGFRAMAVESSDDEEDEEEDG